MVKEVSSTAEDGKATQVSENSLRLGRPLVYLESQLYMSVRSVLGNVGIYYFGWALAFA